MHINEIYKHTTQVEKKIMKKLLKTIMYYCSTYGLTTLIRTIRQSNVYSVNYFNEAK